MCGIAGVLLFNGKSVEKSMLADMSETLKHRGPDGHGVWISENQEVGFSHRRLSIIDLTPNAGQPMHYAEGRFTIVFNGEIYNYVELREWLIRLNYQFQSTSDTEVILALFHYKGEKMLEYLDGMFAFAIWDEAEKKLFCARDRFGEKPFFYVNTKEGFYFASEIKALCAINPALKVSTGKLQQYIDVNYKSGADETFFEDVSVLPPAHSLTVRDGKNILRRYWQIDLSKQTRYVRESQYFEHFYELFRRSVARRLRSDVAVGSSLSGGLDSTAVVCCIREFMSNPFTTFSARFKDHDLDEG
ncbi:MAG: asparagine synthase (glutamine-hydrolyzing), partial [Bacteroidota bacterium]